MNFNETVVVKNNATISYYYYYFHISSSPLYVNLFLSVSQTTTLYSRCFFDSRDFVISFQINTVTFSVVLDKREKEREERYYMY